MRNDNTYAKTIAYYVSDCISGRNNLTTWNDFSGGSLMRDALLNGEAHTTLKDLHKSVYGMTSMPTDTVFLKKVIFNDPATIAFWSDGTKTIVKAQPGDIFDPEKGLAMVIAKKACGNKGNYYNGFKKWLPKEPVGNEEIIYKPEKHEDTIEEDEYYE